MTLDRVYAACLEWASACDRHSRMVLWVGVPAYTLFLATVATLVLQRFPNSGDEYVYLYQAATLAEGRLSNPAPAFPEFFTFNYIASDDGRAFGTFPPGWPVALAGAHALRLPRWLLNPLLGTASLMLVWALGRDLHGPRIGVLAAALTGLSAFFIFNAASYFSHTFCGFLLLLAAWLAADAGRRPTIVAPLVGLLVGWAVLTRYFTGVVAGIGIAALLVRTAGPPAARPLLLMAMGGVPWMAFLFWYNESLSGNMWRLTTQGTTVSLWFAPGFALRGLDILSTQLLQFILWTPPALLAAYVWYLRRADPASRRGPLDWLFAVTAVVLIFYVNRGGNQYGPRFYYEAFLFLVIFTTANLFRAASLNEASRGTRMLFAALVASVVVGVLLIGVHAWQARQIIRERRDPFTRVAMEGITNAVVLVDGRVGTARSMDARDLTRNGIRYDKTVLFALDRGAEENCRLAAAMRDRSMYLYSWDAGRREGRLTPLRCK
jgi:hypothetical protein